MQLAVREYRHINTQLCKVLCCIMLLIGYSLELVIVHGDVQQAFADKVYYEQDEHSSCS